MVEFFKIFCNWLDRQTELYTIIELHEQLWTFAVNDDVPSIKWLKQKVERTLWSSIFFTETPHFSNTVCFKDMAAGAILNDKWYQYRKANLEERMRVIHAAANLIKNEIQCTQYETDSYPSLNDIEKRKSILPPFLMLLMECLITSQHL